MHYLAWLNAHPMVWPLLLLAVSILGTLLFIVATSITI